MLSMSYRMYVKNEASFFLYVDVGLYIEIFYNGPNPKPNQSEIFNDKYSWRYEYFLIF